VSLLQSNFDGNTPHLLVSSQSLTLFFHFFVLQRRLQPPRTMPAKNILPKFESKVVSAKHDTSTGLYKLSQEARAEGLAAIENATKRLKLNCDGRPHQIVGKKGTMLGTDSAKESSIERYETVWQGLLDFCIATQDYESGIILHRPKCPSDPFPVSLDTAVHYMRFRIHEKGSPLLHYETNEPVCDPNGNQLFCRGDWQGSSTVGLYRSALSKLHNHYESCTGPHAPKCARCADIGSRLSYPLWKTTVSCKGKRYRKCYLRASFGVREALC
jgi:hypothetical protein